LKIGILKIIQIAKSQIITNYRKLSQKERTFITSRNAIQQKKYMKTAAYSGTKTIFMFLAFIF
jgi:hypothetical protein